MPGDGAPPERAGQTAQRKSLGPHTLLHAAPPRDLKLHNIRSSDPAGDLFKPPVSYLPLEWDNLGYVPEGMPLKTK